MTTAFQRWQKAIAVSLSTLRCTTCPRSFSPVCLQAVYTLEYQNTISTYNLMLDSQCQEVQSSSCVFPENCSYLCSSVWEMKQRTFLISILLLCS